MRRIVIVGSTGSVGTQALDVVERSPELEVVGLGAASSWELLVEQAKRFDVKRIALANEDLAARAGESWTGGEVLAGAEGLVALITESRCDLVLNALTGSAGLGPTVATLGEGKEDLFLALLERHTADDVREYDEIFSAARTLDEQARGGADEWMRKLQREPDYFPLFIEFWAHAVRDPGLRSRFAASFAAFRQAFGRMVQEGARELGVDVSPEDAEYLGIVVNALGNGMALEKLADPDGVPDDLLGTALSLMFQSLLAAAQRGELSGGFAPAAS